MIFLSFLVLFINSRFSTEYCFLINILHIAVFTASVAAKNNFSSFEILPCNFSSSFAPPGISVSARTTFTRDKEERSEPETTFTHDKEERSEPCNLEAPVTIHNKNPPEMLLLRHVGMKFSPSETLVKLRSYRK